MIQNLGQLASESTPEIMLEVKELLYWNSQSFGNLVDVTDARVSFTLFDKSYVCPMNAHDISKLFLSDTFTLSN